MWLKNESFHVAGIGEILWDNLPSGKQLGGAPANFAYHVSILGATSYIISAIGNDPSGTEIIQQLNHKKLSTDYISIINQRTTGSVEVKVDTEGKPKYTIRNNVAWDYIPYSDKNANLAKHLHAICFGSLAQRSKASATSIQRILKITPEKCFRIFDINIRQNFYSPDMIETSLENSNCLKLNEDEYTLIAGLFSYSGSEANIISTLLNNFELDLVALTKGENGSALYTKSEISVLNPTNISIVDTVGAGDSFTAALCLGWLNNLPLENIHKMANRLASFVCTQKGATPPIPAPLLAEILPA